MAINIPDSVWLEIFSCLPKSDLVAVSAVSRKWRRISRDRSLWRNISSEELDLSSDVTDQVIKQLLVYGQNIASLSLVNCIAITNKVIINLSLCSNKLETLILEGCLNMSDRGILTLAKHCSNLKCINLLDTRVTGIGLSRLVEGNLQLREVTASTSAMTETTIKVIAGHCKFLVDLLVEPNITFQETRPLLKQRSTEILTDEMLVYIAINCPSLRSLVLKYPTVQICDWSMAILGNNCKMLEAVEFGTLDYDSKISDVGVVNLCLSLKHLRHLELKETNITDSSLHAIAASCKGMRHLDLQNCRKLSDIGILDLLKHCAQLESLALGCGWEGHLTNISAIGLSNSPCARNLISLKIYLWEINDFGFYVMSYSLPQLIHLSIEGCTKITYTGLSDALGMLVCLKTLDLSFTKCINSDIELLALAKLFLKLLKLTLYECNGVSAYGLNDLKSYIPHCTIESEKIILL